MKKYFLFIPFILLFSILFLMGCSNKKENDNNNISKDTTTTSTGDATTTTSTGVEDEYYTIIFKDYDGTILQSSSVKKGDDPKYNKSNPTRLNDDNYSYSFNGWSPTIVSASADAEYTATYTSQLLAYSILIDLDGGTSTQTKLQFRTDNVTKDILPFDVKRSGFAFKGYELDNTKVFDEKGNIVKSFQPSSNMTFKAIYEEAVTLTIYYTLYNPKTGELIETYNIKPDFGSVSETRSYHYNTYVDLYANPNEGYTFVGWYIDNQVLSNNTDYKHMMWDEDVTIEARFKYTLYDLKVWSNNYDLGQVIIREGNNQTFYNEETLQEYYKESVTIVAYSKTDTRFLGWYDENNKLVSTNPAYTLNMINVDYTLEAKWDKFYINYELNRGTNNPSNPRYYTSNTQNITLLIPTRDGYTFQGWEYKNNVITEINTANICHMELKALWTYYTLTTNVNNSKAGTVLSYNNTKITKDKSITIIATTNPGYTFNGWYDGDKELTKNLSYTFNMPAENLSYTARWTANNNTAYKVEHYLQNLDDNNYPTTPYETDNLTGTTDTLTNGEVKTYEGFTSPTITQVNINGDGSTVIKVNYTRNTYTVSLSQDNDKAGTITGAGTYKYGKSITVTSETNPGYTFNGWYNGDNQTSPLETYTFNMPANNLSYKAKWTANTNTAYRVEYYFQTIYNEYLWNPSEIDNLTGTTDTLTNVQVKTYEGFTSPSITQVNINGDGSTVIKLHYSRNEYSVLITENIENAGNLRGAGSYKYESSIQIKATAKPGYTFIGWYLNDEIYSEGNSFNYTICSYSVEFEARFTVNQYTITIDNQAEHVIITGITNGNMYDYDSQIKLIAKNESGLFVIWKIGESVVCFGDEYTFNVPANDVTIVITTSPYVRRNNKIYFGTYPQTKVNDVLLIDELNILAGDLPMVNDAKSWSEYNYYLDDNLTSFMYYQDIDYDNNGTYDYRGVYFTQFRTSYQEKNGYLTNNIYWFSYDPIEWDILETNNNKLLIITNLMIDSQEYYPNPLEGQFEHNNGSGYANNYELSEVRKFLNDIFYDTAFSNLQKTLIEKITVDNSVSSIESNVNERYVCDDTNDKIFILSYKEVNKYYKKDGARQAQGSDYAKVQGLFTVYKSDSNYIGNGDWYLRSPGNGDEVVSFVHYTGELNGWSCCYDASCGIRPVCWLIM